MKTLYLSCAMGAAGDMLMAALLELIPDKHAFLETMNHLGLAGVQVSAEAAVKQGIVGTQISVRIHGQEEQSRDVHVHHHAHHEHAQEHAAHDHTHTHTHHTPEHHHHHAHTHTSLRDIEQIIAGLNVSEQVRSDVLAVYTLIAEAESSVHGKPVAEIHFHEVGTMDAIADITGVCLLMEQLHPDQVLASPVHLGSGFVQCMHGTLPVPAPATAHILRQVPAYTGTIEGELCTPTGAALLKHFVTTFQEMPTMQVEQIGYGMGKKEFPMLNCVRAFLGTTETAPESVVELSCNLDDMTGEAIGYASELLLREGACDVFTQQIGMKKSRPGILLTCLCLEQDREKMCSLLFQHTTTLGIREQLCRRYTLHRSVTTFHSSVGDVRMKCVQGYGTDRFKAEYADVAQIAAQQQLPFDTVKTIVEQEFQS